MNTGNEMYVMEEFLIANGMSQLPNSSMTNDLSPFDYFDGGLDVQIDNEFSDARGRRKSKRRKVRSGAKNRKTGFQKVMSYTPIGMAKEGIDRYNSPESRNRRDSRKRERQRAKRQQQTSQEKNLRNLTKSGETDALLLAQLTTPPVVAPSTGMNKTTRTILVVGGISIALFVGFVLYKKFKK